MRIVAFKTCGSCRNDVPIDGFGSARRSGEVFFCSERCEKIWVGGGQLEFYLPPCHKEEIPEWQVDYGLNPG